MTDEKITFRVDGSTKQQLDTYEHLNVSSLMRSLTENYVHLGDTVEVSLQRKLKDKENKLDRKRLEKQGLENDIERIEREIEDIQQKIKERREQTPESVIEFAEKIKAGRFPQDKLDADNPAVKNYAQKAGLPPTQFINKVQERL